MFWNPWLQYICVQVECRAFRGRRARALRAGGCRRPIGITTRTLQSFDPTEFCLAVFVVQKWICDFSSHVLQFVEADGIPVGAIVVDLLHSGESQRIMPGVGGLVEPSAHHLDDEWIFEEFCGPERLTLVQLDVELGSGESKRQLAKFPSLIKIEDVLLRDIISIDRVHNTEFRLHVKPTNIVLIFETAKVESRPGQLADTKLGHIFRVASAADNGQICGITEAPDIIFFHLDIPIRPAKRDKGLVTSFEHQSFPTVV
jgi:hypothetical protein